MQNTSLQLQIKKLTLHALQSLDLPDVEDIQLERPSRREFGDWTTNIALQSYKLPVASNKFSNPRLLAEAIVKELEKLNSNYQLPITNYQVAGPGFINFYLSHDFYVAEMTELVRQRAKMSLQKNAGKKVIVEFSSPNIAKPFTVGHLRSTIIGDAVANLLSATGYQVFRDNHLGDWGTQFGKQIVAIKKWGDLEQMENSENPVLELVQLYIKFHEEAEKDPRLEDEGRLWFKKLEDGDPEARALWQKCIDWSWKEFSRIYDELGVSFTENGGRGYGESYFEDKMSDVVKELKASGFLKEGKEGAQLFFFPNDELQPLMILKKDGSTLYATRDLATDKFRLQRPEYQPLSLVINEVGGEQEYYFRQIYKIEELLGWYKPGQRVHVKHGMFRFKEGKMSTRKGNVIWLTDVIEEAKKRAGDKFKVQSSKFNVEDAHDEDLLSQSITTVAIGAMKWNDLKRASHLDVVFDWDEMLSMEGNSGPYLQYTYVRTVSVLKKANDRYKVQGSRFKEESIDQLPKLNPEEVTLLQLLAQFQEVVELSAEQFAPHHVCTYLYELAQAFNTFYNKHSILGSRFKVQGLSEQDDDVDHTNDQLPITNQPTTKFRLQLTQAVSLVIKEGLGLLGIQTVEEM